MKTLKLVRFTPVGALALALAATGPASSRAADIFWTGGTASYTNTANWTGGIVPGASDNAINPNGLANVVQINTGNPDWTVIDIRAGSTNADGAFTQNDQTVNVNGWLIMGAGDNATGIYTLNNGTVNVIGGRIFLGDHPASTSILNINGGTINKTGDAFVLTDGGWNGNSSRTGTVNQVNGTVNCSSEIWVGQLGDGTSIGYGIYNLSGGTINVSNWVAIGRSGGNGKMTVTGGALNKYNGGNNFLVGTGFSTPAGGSGVGQLDHSAGLINIQGGQLLIPENSPSSGLYNLSGTATLIVNDWIAIGRGGAPGTMNMSGGSVTKTGGGNIVIGAGGGSVGILTQTGGAITNTTSQVWIAEDGTGTWNMNGGLAVLGTVHIGQTASSVGTWNLNGGVCSAFEVTSGNPIASSTLILNGGTLQANGDNATFLHDLITAQVNTNGAVFDSAGFNISIPQQLTDAGGGLTKNGAGTLTLTAANSYTGTTVVNAGALAITTDASGGGGYSVANGANLSVKVQAANAQLNAASLTLASSTSAALSLDLGSFGNPSSAPMNVSGALAVNGTITINIADGLPQLGQFPLIKYGSRTGTGSFVLGALPIGIVASIVTNVPNSSIDLNITTVNTPRWDGQAGGNWDIGVTTNWINAGTGLPTFFNNGNPVVFDDNALGTTTVNLTTTVNPAAVTANNSSLSYTITGSGKISGSAGLTKGGTGILTLVNTGGNNYTGVTTIANGTLSVSNLANGGSASAIGAASANPTNLVFTGGTLSYTGPATAINRGYSAAGNGGAIDTATNLTLSGAVINSSAGEMRKLGLGQLAYTGLGSNGLSGYLVAGSAYRVGAGTVLLDGSAGPQTNYSRNLRLGTPDGVSTLNSALILTNTILDVRNGFTLGQSNNATATLVLNNSTLFHRGNGNAFDIGDNNNGLPCTGVVVQNSSTFNADGEIWVGQTTNGIGSYTLNSGTINLHNWLAIGRAGGSGTFTMTGGTFNKDGNGNFVIATGAGDNARSGYGTFNHSGGTINDSSEYWLAENTPAAGTNNISGTAVLNLNNWMSIGRGGLGVINFSGGTINKTGGGNFIVGDNGTGFFIQTGGALTINSELWIAQAGGGNGTYSLSAGTVTNNSWLAVGREGGKGTLNISGGSMTKQGGGNISITHGGGATGTINQTGGSFTCASGETWIGEDSGPGVWNISGGVATLGFVQLARNSSATGTLNLNGGTFAANEITTGSAGTSTLNFNGGTLGAVNGANPNFLHGLTTASVLSGGAIIDSGTNVINVSQALLDGTGGGGLTKNGTGTLRLNGINTYTGTTVVNAGTLGGTGTIAGPVAVGGSATLAPGASIGTLTVNSSVTLGGTTLMEISKDGGVPASDLLTVSGNLAYSGALTVVITGTNRLAFNDTFNLFDWGTRSGSFSSLNLPAGYLWDTSQLSVDGTIRVIGVSPAQITSSSVSGGNLVLQGAGGPPGASYSWLTSTNIAAPMSTWTTNSTGVFDGSGGFSNAFPISTSVQKRFFRLKTP